MTQVPGGQLGRGERARCHAVIRAPYNGGYERCHGNTGHEPLPHHVRGRGRTRTVTLAAGLPVA